jgi:SAM-dependent methyltransferase|tara:strand:+ start:4160 stop:5017 length:858 start_codon:yes stop_codon:yes gene_type:complete
MGLLKKLSAFTEKLGVELKQANKDKLTLSTYQKIFPKDSIANKRFYNIGAGGFLHPYWTNVDYYSDWYKGWAKNTDKGINYNLFSHETLPIDDNSAEILYTSHTIEHIDNASSQYFFNEAFRVLKSGGIFRITCPDIHLQYRAYQNNDNDFYYWKTRFTKNGEPYQPSIEQLFVQRFATAITEIPAEGIDPRMSTEEIKELFKKEKLEDALDTCTNRCTVEFQKQQPGNHMNWWSYGKLEKMLKEAGFKTMYRSGYAQSASDVLRNTHLFDNTHPKMSMYMEARK